MGVVDLKFDRRALENIALISQIGISMMTPIILCMLLGNYIDKKMNNSQPIFLIILTILGVGTSFVSLFKLTMKGKDRKRK